MDDCVKRELLLGKLKVNFDDITREDVAALLERELRKCKECLPYLNGIKRLREWTSGQCEVRCIGGLDPEMHAIELTRIGERQCIVRSHNWFPPYQPIPGYDMFRIIKLSIALSSRGKFLLCCQVYDELEKKTIRCVFSKVADFERLFWILDRAKTGVSVQSYAMDMLHDLAGDADLTYNIKLGQADDYAKMRDRLDERLRSIEGFNRGRPSYQPYRMAVREDD